MEVDGLPRSILAIYTINYSNYNWEWTGKIQDEHSQLSDRRGSEIFK